MTAAPTISDGDIAALLPQPGSILRRRVSDPRALAGAAGYALTLQVAHPTIAAGVRDHSTYAIDPWGRAFRTADYIFLLCYGDSSTVANVARNLRAMHRSITGTDQNGRRYSALEPSAYAWVHATIGESIVRGHALMGTPLSPDECDELWAGWLDLGEVLGVRRAELPASWAGFTGYFDAMVHDVLEDNAAIHELKAASRRAVGGSPFRWLPSPVFGVVGVPLGRVLRFLGIGMLPPELRDRFGLRWTAAHAAAFAAHCSASRASMLPRVATEMGPLHLRMRRHEIGPFGQTNAAAQGIPNPSLQRRDGRH